MGAACWLRLAWLALLRPARSFRASAAADQPMLRINAPGHIARITRIATDAAERFAVTASDDKTVRVWLLPDGALLRVIWLPSGEGDLGKAYAVALSPDGSTIAVAAGLHLGATSICSTARLGRCCSGCLTCRTSSTTWRFSPDGKRLAAPAPLVINGIRVFDVLDGYRALPSDGDYRDHSRGWISTAPVVWCRRASTGSCGFIRRTVTTSRPRRPESPGSADHSPSRSRPTGSISPSGIRTVRRWRC